MYDANEAQLDKAIDAGGIEAGSPREVAEKRDYIIVGVSFEPEVYACLTNETGALSGIAAGGAIALCSTASVSAVQRS